jgi:hypothetical protein
MRVVYVNHRPYVDVSQETILKALSLAVDESNEGFNGEVTPETKISKEKLTALIQQFGMLS